MGSLFVSQIERAQVLAVLEPIWLNKTETANRLRGRIEKILDYAKALNLRSGDNPAAWKGGLETILAKPSKIQMIVHHAALEHNNIGMFMADLRVINSMAARCLEFCILTATRSGEARGTRWSEIDLEAALWHIPAERMKAGKPHTVPLSMQVQALLKALPCVVGADYVFPAAKKLRPLSDMTLTTVLRRMDLQVTTHGFRSTFRDWAADCTHIDRQTCEQALAHQLPDKVEAAYLRSNLLLKRRPLMQQWADRCDILQT
jgi:integrase